MIWPGGQSSWSSAWSLPRRGVTTQPGATPQDQVWDSPAIIIGGVADHIHVLFPLSKNHALAKVVEEVKTGTSKWIKSQNKRFTKFHWQRGYGAFSVSPSNLEQVKRYIERQEEHHRRRTFQDELRQLLKRHGVEFDERYVWD